MTLGTERIAKFDHSTLIYLFSYGSLLEAVIFLIYTDTKRGTSTKRHIKTVTNITNQSQKQSIVISQLMALD